MYIISYRSVNHENIKIGMNTNRIFIQYTYSTFEITGNIIYDRFIDNIILYVGILR